MGKRNNKDLEDRMMIIQEKSNEHLARSFSLENDIEKLKLNVDKEISDKEGYIKQRDYFKIQNDKIAKDNKKLEETLMELRKNYETTNEKIAEKDKKIIDLTAMETIYEQRFHEFVKKIEDLKNTVDNLDKENQTLVENNKTYTELNGALKKEQEELTIKMKKMNDERNHSNELLESANRKIASFIDQIHFNEELIARSTKEHEKIKGKLVHSERYSDVLEIKKSAFERTVEVQKIQMLEQIKTVSEQASSEKEARQKWIERYENEYKSHLETTSEVMLLRTENKEFKHKNNNLAIELNLIRNDYEKVTKAFEEKRLGLSDTLKELGIFAKSYVYRGNTAKLGSYQRHAQAY